MPPSDESQAVLIVLHNDVVLPGELEDTMSLEADEESAIPPTRQKPEYLLTGQGCIIGRNPECAIRFKDHRTDISRRHATIKRNGAIYMLHDLKSLNGTFVNHQRIEEGYSLHSNDVLGFADTMEMLRFKDLAHPEAVLLTEREHEVLGLMASGLHNKEMARELGIDQETVKKHAHHIYRKLGVRGRVEAIARARILGLLRSRSAQ